MISKEELKRYGRIFNLNLGQAEKDYFQNIILFILSQNYGKDLVFKGGTAMKKCYGLDRFSEDLDFTCIEKINLGKLEEGLKRFKTEYEIKTEKYEDGLKAILLINGPLYTGSRQSLCKFIIDLSFRETIVLPPIVKTIGRYLEEIPSFDVLVMDEREILAEKIRAILTRNKARDVYDLWFLLEKGIILDKKILQEKFNYYGQIWNLREFRQKLSLKEAIWLTELKPLLNNVPEFEKVQRKILEKLAVI